MTDEFKVILDGYLKWCKDNNQDPCAASVTDADKIDAMERRGILRSIHLPDRERDTPTTAAEAENQCFNRLLSASKHIANVIGIDQEIVFKVLLESIAYSSVVHPPDIIRNAGLINNCIQDHNGIFCGVRLSDFGYGTDFTSYCIFRNNYPTH